MVDCDSNLQSNVESWVNGQMYEDEMIITIGSCPEGGLTVTSTIGPLGTSNSKVCITLRGSGNTVLNYAVPSGGGTNNRSLITVWGKGTCLTRLSNFTVGWPGGGSQIDGILRIRGGVTGTTGPQSWEHCKFRIDNVRFDGGFDNFAIDTNDATCGLIDHNYYRNPLSSNSAAASHVANQSLFGGSDRKSVV